MFLQSLGFGLAVLFIILGIVGVLIPFIPGTLLVWLTVLVYAVVEGFGAIDPAWFAVMTVLALVSGTADFWMPLLGAKASGASLQAMVGGAFGSLVGIVFFSLPGAVVGYAAGLIVGEYYRFRDWNKAIRSSVGGLAGYGVSTLVQLGGAVLISILFLWQVLSY